MASKDNLCKETCCFSLQFLTGALIGLGIGFTYLGIDPCDFDLPKPDKQSYVGCTASAQICPTIMDMIDEASLHPGKPLAPFKIMGITILVFVAILAFCLYVNDFILFKNAACDEVADGGEPECQAGCHKFIAIVYLSVLVVILGLVVASFGLGISGITFSVVMNGCKRSCTYKPLRTTVAGWVLNICLTVAGIVPVFMKMCAINNSGSAFLTVSHTVTIKGLVKNKASHDNSLFPTVLDPV